MIEKSDLFLLLKKMKKIFLRKEFHSQYEFMQSWINTNTNIVVHDPFLYFNNLHVLKSYFLFSWEKFISTSKKICRSVFMLRKIQIYI